MQNLEITVKFFFNVLVHYVCMFGGHKCACLGMYLTNIPVANLC